MARHTLLAAAGLLALVGCAAPTPPDYAAQYQPALDAFMAGWNDGNVGGLDAAVTESFQRRSPGGLNSDGLDAFKKIVTDLRASYPDARVVLDESHFMKDLSFHLWTFIGTNTGSGATPPSGKSVKLTGATLIRYQDGKIDEELVYFDALDWQTQLGFTLTPPASGEAPAAN
jgi:hypothetical protein